MGVLYFMQKTSIILHFYIDDCFYFLYFKIVRNRVVMRFNAYLDMQKSRKLMVSLCGLALSSLFVLNNKSVVHADIVSDAQNNAITWDSDQDDSQVVQSTQTKTEQAMPQKADDHQQNATQPVQNNAEMSTVRSSSADRLSATNKSATSVQNSRANLISNVDSAAPRQTPAQQAPVQAKQKVASVQEVRAVNPVVIKNPAGNKVHVNWVNSKGEAIPDTNGYDIDLSKVGTQSEYHWIPNGYQLIKNGNFSVTKNTHIIPHHAVTHQGFKILKGTLEIKDLGGGGPVEDSLGTHTEEYYVALIHWNDGEYCRYTNKSYVLINGSRWSGNTEGADISDLNELLPHRPILGESIGINDKEIEVPSTKKQTIIDKPAYDETVTDGYTFTDNSGAVLKQSGNTINVGLIKPQHVDPATDARMRATATRTIQFNFPGQIPPSYKNIVDDKGELIQTVTFTRTGQEDALTGDLIDNTLTPWKSDNKDPNFIGFEPRTLPKIPGYTLSIKPANA